MIEWIKQFEQTARPANEKEYQLLVWDHQERRLTEDPIQYALDRGILVHPLPEQGLCSSPSVSKKKCSSASRWMVLGHTRKVCFSPLCPDFPTMTLCADILPSNSKVARHVAEIEQRQAEIRRL